MILGVGTDLCTISRVERLFLKYGNHFLDRIYTEKETAHAFSIPKKRFKRLAQMFAVKEAAVKAIGTGIRLGVRFLDVEMITDDLGKPFVVLHGKALSFASQKISDLNQKGDPVCHVSVSDEGDTVVAFVVLTDDL